jgi:hypothetical protein
MASLSPAQAAPRRLPTFVVRETWVALAITAMWVAVIVTAIWAPDIHTVTSTPGGSTTDTTIPSGVAVGLFAFLGTWVVARYGLRRRDD